MHYHSITNGVLVMELNKNKGLREEQYSSWSRDIFDPTRFKKTLTLWREAGFLESVSNSSQMTWHKSNIYLAEKRVWKLITNSFLCSACCQKTNKPCCLKHTQSFQVFYCNLTSWFVIIKLWHRFSFGFASSWFSTIHFHGIVSRNSNVMFLLFHRTIIADFWKTQIVVRYSVEIPTWTVGTIEIGNQ